MTAENLGTIISLIIALIGMVIAWFAYRRPADQADREAITALERRLTTVELRTQSLPPIGERITMLETKTEALVGLNVIAIDKRLTRIESRLENVREYDTSDRLARLETKVDIYFGGLAKDAAQVMLRTSAAHRRRDD